MDYNALDPGIRDLVRHLNERGYTTTDSGDGVTKPLGPEVMPFRHVVVQEEDVDYLAACVLAKECHNLKAVIEAFDVGHSWSVEATYTTLGEGWSILASEYDPDEIARLAT